MNPTHLILASASPRRRELLERVGLRFRVDAADVDESVLPGEKPAAYVLRLAQAKALRVAARHPGAVVLAADTTVVLGEEILGKPENPEDALRMLRALRGRTHQVFSGVALAGACSVSQVVRTHVRMREATDAELRWYVQSGEPMDKAGAYGMQGVGAFLVTEIEGSPTSVIGLPLPETLALLAQSPLPLPWSVAP